MSTRLKMHPFEVTRNSVFALVWPVMLASITVPLMGITDTAVIGQLGDTAMLGGLAVGAVIFDVIFTGLNFLRASTTGLTAQALGARDEREQQAVLVRAVGLSLVVGVSLVLASGVLLDIGLALMRPSSAVASAVTLYFGIRILAAPFTLLNYSILGWLLGLAHVRLGLALQVIASSFNIVMSIYLGLIKGGGIAGVAWATLLSEGLATLLGTIIVLHKAGNIWPGVAHVFDGQKIKRTLSLNSDIMVRSLALLFAFSFFTAQSSRLGDVTLAANGLLLNFFLLSAFMLDGFSNAVEQLVGKAIGARYQPAFDQAVRISLFWSGLLSLVLFCLLMLLGPITIDGFTPNEMVRVEAKRYLIWAALTGVFGVLAFLMDGVYIGATWTREMRNMMLLSLFVYLLAWWQFLPIWQNHGLWLALEIFLGIRGITLLSRYPINRRQEFGVRKTA